MYSLNYYTEKETTKLFETLGAFFAFSNKQVEEKKKEGIKYFNMGSGLICPAENCDQLNKDFELIHNEGIKKRVEDMGVENIISYEFYNYETAYTYEEEDAREALTDYIEIFPELFTPEKINEVFQKCYNEAE